MAGGTNYAFFVMVLGNTLGAHQEILERLKKRLKLQEVSLVDESGVVLAFVPVVSRAGTDIEAALKMIPTDRPVILIVIHNTFDPDCVVPDSSKLCESLKEFNNVLAVDFLCYDERGLLQSWKNDMALQQITDYLKALGIPARSPKVPCNYVDCLFWIGLSVVVCVIILIYLYFYTDLLH